MVPLAHLSRGLRRDGPGRAKSRGSYDTSQFSKQFSPSCTAPHPYYQRCWTPVAVPPPFKQSQPFSVGIFSLREGAGSWALVRVPADFRDRPTEPVRAWFWSLLGVFLSWSAGCPWARSATRQKLPPTKQRVTRGRIEWLDAIIGHPTETTRVVH